jgi:SAM-dependent methyltransferase
MNRHPKREIRKSCLTLLDTIRELGRPLSAGGTVLDFGCGQGQHVVVLRQMGYRAFGCDIVEEHADALTQMEAAGLAAGGEEVFRPIGGPSYSLPFPDSFFDFIFSNQVFEHVQDYPGTIQELGRILKPGGCCLHRFPSRYRPIEAHVFVPLASIFQSKPYLTFWALLGIRNRFQHGLDFREVANRNHAYLAGQTCYLTKDKLKSLFAECFDDVRFVETTYLRCSRGFSRHLSLLAEHLPAIPALYSAFFTRVVFCSHGE